MLRSVLFGLIVALSSSSLLAQEWATKMFKVHSHNWGNVPRMSKTEFPFEFTNLYRDDVHIVDARVSCGCTSVQVVTPVVKTGEKGMILAKFNTQSHSGAGSATITVTIDKPQYAEVTLSVRGYVRTDVTLEPGYAEFGDVDQGAKQSRSLNVSFAGRSDLKIATVTSSNPQLRGEATLVRRGYDEVVYRVDAHLAEEAAAGYLNEQLVLTTDDQRQVPVPVRGRVVGPLTVSPATMFVGLVKPGEQVSKQLVVRGKQPFKIMRVTCPDARFEFKTNDEEKTVHMIPIVFKADDKVEKVTQTVEVVTNLNGQTSGSCVCTVRVLEK